MFSALRNRLRVSPATVIATLALVFAMTGGAYAAKKYLITSTKQISPSVLKSLQGKAGPAGSNGAPGAQGPAGPAGAAGAQGPTGAAGVKGETGAPGAKGTTGSQGATGAKGTTGFTETLPSGKTETGTWSGAVEVTGNAKEIFIPISFTLPVEPEPTLVFVSKGESPLPPGCPGVVNGLPLAELGKLCIYVGFEIEAVFAENTKTIESEGIRKTSEGVGPSGTVLTFGCEHETGCSVKGTWAVTAE